MNRPLQQPHRFFVGTHPLPCPYLDGRIERMLIAEVWSRRKEIDHGSLELARVVS